MSTKTALMKSHFVRIIQMIGGVIAISIGSLAILGLLIELTEPGIDSSETLGGLIFSAIIFLIGLVLIIFSITRKKLINEFKTYVRLLSNDSIGSISNLSSKLNTPENEVKEKLRKMIEKKYFANAYIDTQRNRIVLNGNENSGENSRNVNVGRDYGKVNTEYLSVECKNCGGNSKVLKGSVGECDFCGSPISK